MTSVTAIFSDSLYSVILSEAASSLAKKRRVEGPLYPHARSTNVLRVHRGQPFRNALHRDDGQSAQASLRATSSIVLRVSPIKYDVERLLYWESYDDVHKAIGREKQLKGWRREKKIVLIESMNPQWLDLSKEWYPWMKECEEGRGASTAEERSRATALPPLSMTEDSRYVFLCHQPNSGFFHSFSTAICFRYIQISGFQPHNSCGQLCLQP